MTSSDTVSNEIAHQDSASTPAPGPPVPPPTPGRAAPQRPATAGKPAPPVIVKRPAPVSVVLAVLCWVVGLMAGAAAVAYLFVIRTPQLEDITAYVQEIEPERAAITHESAAEIIYWCFFGGLCALVLVQVVFLVSFTNRRPKARWYLCGSIVLLAVLYFLGREMVTHGERGEPVETFLLAQLGMLTLALLLSVLPGAVKWSARGHDVRGGSHPTPGAEL